ncbi:MAG: ruvA [Solirubrobacterales bacterium]|nr:ruvA [Solirubrobacterales bacterium]
MIARIAGDVAVRRGDHVVVETASGVGYKIAVSAYTMERIPAVGHPVSLHTELIVREDSMALYGFVTEEEQDLFTLLLGVQSVGPKMALAVLSGGSPRELVTALAAGDAPRFQAVPGIGKRTAERIIVELRDKVGVPHELARTPGDELGVSGARDDDPRLLARDGLIELGYDLIEADRLLSGAEVGLTAEELIGHALKAAARR